MLVIKRHVGERIRIGPDTWLEIIRIEGQAVRLGFVAPEQVKIMREELLPEAEMFEVINKGKE